MAAPGGVIVLDDEDEAGTTAAAAPPPAEDGDKEGTTAAPPPEPAEDARPNGGDAAAASATSPRPLSPSPRPLSPRPPATSPRPPSPGAAEGSYTEENERLFAEFVELCGRLTQEHPEVLPFLAARRRKAAGAFLGSAELRVVLRRCLARVRARRDKVYVYINELCTVLKAHAPRRKLPLAPAAAPENLAAAPVQPATSDAPAPALPSGSKRQIRSLENLLRVYAGEIRRLQERELDLAELDRADSPYVQEGRLKRRLMRVFERLCALKRCSSLTGRVAEQRVAYRGTRYPEVNRRIERFVNRPAAAFPDYADILKVIEKASARHGLALPRRRMESMAQDAFREVGNRLQERRHLDLVYNFGSHLTDQYRPGSDPALGDAELARRLRRNRALALTRLDAVIARYARMQERGEDRERGRRRHRPGDGSGDGGGDGAQGAPSGAGPSRGDSDSDSDSDDDDGGAASEEAEEEEGSSGAEEEGAAAPAGDAEGPEEAAAAPKAGPSPELFVVEIEALPLEAGETPPPSPPLSPPPSPPPSPSVPGASEATPKAAPSSPEPSEAAAPSPDAVTSRPAPAGDGGDTGDDGDDGVVGDKRKRPPGSRHLENGAGGTISSTSCNGRKRRRLLPHGDSPPTQAPVAVGGPPGAGARGPLPDSTRADSPGHGLVSSSQGSPRRPPAPPGKASVATQCDPEEIIVLSDSD